MSAHHLPADEAQVAELIRAAGAARTGLEVMGQGSRRQLGRSTAAESVLDVSALSGVLVYEPEELVLSARAATPLAEIQALLAGRGQHLAFEPPDFGPLWGAAAGRGTLAGAISVGLGGSRRMSAGAPRDHFLGFRAVNGFGEAFAGGGRVVKNVTGFDLPKLLAGAYGTLGVLTEVTLKVLPAPEDTRTLAWLALEDEAGLALLRRALGGPVPVTGAAHLPVEVLARLEALPHALIGGSATLLRLEGPQAATSAYAAALRVALDTAAAPIVELEQQPSLDLWRQISDGRCYAGSERPLWRLSIPPLQAARLGTALRAAGAQRLYYDWGGGLLWLEGLAGDDGGAMAIRALLRQHAGEGHATLIRATSAVRAHAEPFEPQPVTLRALSERVRAQFDPLGILNPQRMYRRAA
ncbi:MAG: FAD-binding protein [Steroidobacteraceae bacterium]